MIELSRNITFGQYINNGSALTRMDPRTKLLCAILLITVISIVNNFTSFALCLLFCVVLQRTSRISAGYVLGGFRIFIAFLIFVFFLQILFYQTPPHTPIRPRASRSRRRTRPAAATTGAQQSPRGRPAPSGTQRPDRYGN